MLILNKNETSINSIHDKQDAIPKILQILSDTPFLFK